MSSSINIHFLNVEEGDSIVIEFCAKKNLYVVIDSNVIKKNNNFINPAYELLKSKKVKKISALIVSHFHKDHYNGIEFLLNNFEIDKIIIPPIFSTTSEVHNKIIRKYVDKTKELLDRSTDREIIQQANSLANLLFYLTHNENKIDEVSGKEQILRFKDIQETGIVFLPLKKIKGKLQQLMIRDDFDPNFFQDLNDASIAFKLDCYGYKILFSGDSTFSQWQEHKRVMLRDHITNLHIDLLKVPHHGSKYNNNQKLYSYFFEKNDDKRYIFISANGVKHPDKELFNLIEEFNLSPFCTNFSPYCLPPKISRLKMTSDIPKNMIPFLRNYLEPVPTSCQGDILLNLSPSGITINNSTEIPCIYKY